MSQYHSDIIKCVECGRVYDSSEYPDFCPHCLTAIEEEEIED